MLKKEKKDCNPVIPALGRRRPEDQKFRVFVVEESEAYWATGNHRERTCISVLEVEKSNMKVLAYVDGALLLYHPQQKEPERTQTAVSL